MKKILLSTLLLLVTAAVMAIPAKRGLWSTITLSDGTEVRVELRGDEFSRYLQAADGTCYVKRNGIYEQVDKSVLKANRVKRNARRRIISASTSDGLGQYNKMSMGAAPSIGEYTIPVVMVQFKDLKFKSSTTVAKMTRYYNEEGYSDESGCKGSVRDYFKSQSHGMFVPTFDVVGIVTLDKSYKDYGENAVDDDGNSLGDKGVDYLPGDVVSAAISQLGTDFSQYVIPAGDENHLTGVPLLAMFYAGMGEATEEETTGGDYMWPCEWDDVDDPVGKGTYNEIHFNSFFIGNELSTGGSSLMGPGVFCHEFSHALGLPDFYCTDYSYSIDFAFGHWSIMDCGCYVNNAWAPVGYTAYEKSVMGWLDLKEVGDAEEITLQSPLGSSENSAYIIRNSDTETFIFENRQPDTWYPSDFGSGVMVTRVAYDESQWMMNTLNNIRTKKRCCIFTADGEKLYFSASPTNLYGVEKTSIATVKTLSGDKLAVNIKNIALNDDKTITLTFGETSGDDPEGKLFYESFDLCEGTGGNDGKFDGSQTAKATLVPDNEGWSYESGNGADQCAKFGSSKKSGAVTTPEFNVTSDATLTFNAAPWGSDGTTLTLSAASGTVTFDGQETKELTMTQGQWTSYTVKLSGSGTVKLTFTPTKRLFLDEVLVVDNTASTILMGDVNGDGKVDVEDVVAIVNKILGTPDDNFNEAAADINGDGKIDVDDVVAVVNIILQQ